MAPPGTELAAVKLKLRETAEVSDAAVYWLGYLFYMAFSTGFALLSLLLVKHLSPAAGGSDEP